MSALFSSSLLRMAVLTSFVCSLLLCAVCMAGMPSRPTGTASTAVAEGPHGCCAKPDPTPAPTQEHDGSTCDHCDRMLLGVVGVVTKAPGLDVNLLPFDLCPIDPIVTDSFTANVVRIDATPLLSQSPPTLLQLRCAMNL